VMNLFYPLTAGTDSRISTATVEGPIFRKSLPEQTRQPWKAVVPRETVDMQWQEQADRSCQHTQNQARSLQSCIAPFPDAAIPATPRRTSQLREVMSGLQELADPVDALSAAVCSAIVGGLLALLI